MKYVEFGKTGQQVSEMCLGTMMFGDRCDEAESDRILSAAVDAGYFAQGTVLRGESRIVVALGTDSAGTPLRFQFERFVTGRSVENVSGEFRRGLWSGRAVGAAGGVGAADSAAGAVAARPDEARRREAASASESAPVAIRRRRTTWPSSRACLLYTSPSPRGRTRSRMPSFALKKKKKNTTQTQYTSKRRLKNKHNTNMDTSSHYTQVKQQLIQLSK